jgi:hypothetical protein
MLPAVDRPAPDVELLGPDDAPVPLARAWSAGPAVLVFLRHFG